MDRIVRMLLSAPRNGNRRRYAATAVAVLAMALGACSQEPSTQPQLESLSAAALSSAANDFETPAPGAGPEIEYGDTDNPFEVAVAVGQAKLVFRFNGKLRAQETARIGLRAVAADGGAVRGTVSVDFGDGTPPEDVDIRRRTTIEHRFAEAGSYRIVATLHEDSGYTGKGTFRLRVAEGHVFKVDVVWDGSVQPQQVERFAFNAYRSLPSRSSAEAAAPCGVRGTLHVDFGDRKTATVENFACYAELEHAYAKRGDYDLKVRLELRNGPVHSEGYKVEVRQETAPPPPSFGADAIDPMSITVVGAKSTGDARLWPATRSIQMLAFRERHQEWTPDPGWPVTFINGGPAQGNLWFVRVMPDGSHEGAPMEWFLPGQTRQFVDAHHIAGITETWPGWGGPQIGEVMYFFLSTPARIGARSIDERTHIVRVVWGQ